MSKFIFLLIILVQSRLILATARTFDVPNRLKSDYVTIFLAFKDAQRQYNPVDLAEGTPEFGPPENMKQALIDIMVSGNIKLNQYTRDHGHPRLVNAIGKYYSKLLNRTLDSYKNVFITVGATEALFLSLQTHTDPEDEWIIFEPYYEPYFKMVKDAMGVARFISLKPNKINGTITSDDWTFDRQELTNLFNVKTKGIIVNSPNNPIGKVFTLDELTFIADLARKWDTLVIFDEVYQFLTFDNKEHIRMATLPGMFERTISIGSGGKTFSATGWRLGWAYGGAKIINNLRSLHTNTVKAVPTPIQEAFAIAFEDELKHFGTPNSYLTSFHSLVESKRNYLTKALTDIGMTPTLPDGGFFVIANWTTIADKIQLPQDTGESKSVVFTKWLMENVKIFGFPLSGFYSKNNTHLGEGVIRLCYVKEDETLQKAVDLLMRWKNQY